MPLYEFGILFRKLDKPLLMKAVKTSIESVLDHGGYVKTIEHLYTGGLAYNVLSHGLYHTQGSHWKLVYEIPPASLEPITDFSRRDVDVIRFGVFSLEDKKSLTCTFHEETLPAPQRAEVKEMVVAATKKANRHKFDLHMELDYYPFHR